MPEVVGQLDGRKPLGQCSEQTPGFELGELAVVAHQNQLAPSVLYQLGEGGQRAGAYHAGLVDHHHPTWGEPTAVTGLSQQAGDGDRRDAGSGL